MTRWNWKRWAFAVVSGSALAGSVATVVADDMPKAGETITLKFPGQPDRAVTVVKSTRKPDGSLETEVKDAKSGDTFTLVDPAPESKAPAPVAPPVASIPTPPPVVAPSLPPLPKPVAVAPPVAPPAALPVVQKPVAPVAVPQPAVKSPVAAQTPMPPMAEPRDKRRLFNREPEGPSTVAVPNTPAAAAATPPPAPVEDKKPGLLGRVFGKKPSPTPMPATSLPAPAPVAARTNAEPPKAQPAKPMTPPAQPGRMERVVPPTPVVPQISAPSAPSSLPVSLPSKPLPPVAKPSLPPVLKPVAPVETIVVPPAPAKPTLPPVAAPSLPPVVKPVAPVETIVVPPPAKPTLPQVAAPSLPPVVKPVAPVETIVVPPPPAKPTLPPVAAPAVPTIPNVPMSAMPLTPAVVVKPTAMPETVKPASHASNDVETLAATLRESLAPSARLKAVKALATGPHANTDTAKLVLLNTAKTDVCAAVKADCIDALAKLGCRDTAFVEFLKIASTDESGEVRIAAKNALLTVSR